MSEQQNRSPETAEPGGTRKPEPSVQTQPCGGAENGSAASGGLKGPLKTLWRWFNVVVDYIDEEEPEPPKQTGAPESKLKKCLGRINAFLDFLEEGVREPKQKKTFGETLRGIREDCGSGSGRVRLLKSFGGFCWTSFYLGTILVFLFAAALLGTARIMDYVAENRGQFYPAPDVMEYLNTKHEYLEAVADRQASRDYSPMALNDFDVTTLDKLKPINCYRDDYGVYLVTSRDWYAGERGIFIAYDAEKMPPNLNWGLIKGRVFTYADFEVKPLRPL